MKILLTKLALGVALTGALALGSSTASFAFGGNSHYYEHDDNGTTWSFYRGYFSEPNARTNADAGRSHGSVATNPRATRAQREYNRRADDESR